MKKLILLLLLTPCAGKAQENIYIAKADSCFKLKDYVCAATNYDLFLDKIGAESNMIAYRSAISWSLAKNKEKAFASVHKYIKNNASNGVLYFSENLENEKSFDILKDDTRWKAIISAVKKDEAFYHEQERKENENAILNWRKFENALDVSKQLAAISLKNNTYHNLMHDFKYGSPKPYLKDGGLALYIEKNKINVPFYVHIPDNYDPAVASPVLIVLHGGVKNNIGYGNAGSFNMIYRETSEHIPVYSKNYITVYPMGTSTLNWMNTESGFDMVNEILISLKKHLNIDDDRVELIGHSNGATGVFTYLVKSPTLYAGFYGMNTQPKVFIGGTYLQNGQSRHFYNFTTDKDYYYPIKAVKTIDSLAHSLGVNWHTQINPGYPHWFPSLPESLEPMAELFKDMETRKRNPYPEKVYFETDDVKYGTSDWIKITALDTVSKKASWQVDPNFKINEWLDNEDNSKVIYREEMAFDYPHKSGAIRATRKNNTIYVETSNVASFVIKLNQEMIDYHRKLNIYLNGKKVYSKMIIPDKHFMLSGFKANFDRKAIWENEIVLNTIK